MAHASDLVERAAAWAARRTDPSPLSLEESAAYTAWLAEDPENGRRLAALERTWRDPHLQAAAANAGMAHRRHTIGRRAAIGFGAVAAGGAALWLAEMPLRRALADRATAVGEVASFALEPGARVTLDTASAIVREGAQEWALIQGAARLDLEAGSALTLSGRVVRVLASDATFVLRRRPTADRLIVLAGKTVANGVTVAAGYGLTISPVGSPSPEPLGAVERDAAEGFAEAWHRFDDTPLADVLTELERYRLAPVWASAEAARLRVTGRFRFVDPDGVLTALAATLPIRLQRLGPLVRIFQR